MRNLINLAIGLFMVVGGLRGELVFKGSDNSVVIVVIGVLLTLLSIVRFFTKSSAAVAHQEPKVSLPEFDPSRR